MTKSFYWPKFFWATIFFTNNLFYQIFFVFFNFFYPIFLPKYFFWPNFGLTKIFFLSSELGTAQPQLVSSYSWCLKVQLKSQIWCKLNLNQTSPSGWVAGYPSDIKAYLSSNAAGLALILYRGVCEKSCVLAENIWLFSQARRKKNIFSTSADQCQVQTPMYRNYADTILTSQCTYIPLLIGTCIDIKYLVKFNMFSFGQKVFQGNIKIQNLVTL